MCKIPSISKPTSSIASRNIICPAPALAWVRRGVGWGWGWDPLASPHGWESSYRGGSSGCLPASPNPALSYRPAPNREKQKQKAHQKKQLQPPRECRGPQPQQRPGPSCPRPPRADCLQSCSTLRAWRSVAQAVPPTGRPHAQLTPSLTQGSPWYEQTLGMVPLVASRGLSCHSCHGAARGDLEPWA